MYKCLLVCVSSWFHTAIALLLIKRSILGGHVYIQRNSDVWGVFWWNISAEILLLTKAQADHWRVHVTAAFSAVSMILFGTFFPRLISQIVTLLYKRINKENGYHFEGYIYIYICVCVCSLFKQAVKSNSPR